MPDEHRYLGFVRPNPNRRILREIAVHLLNRYFKVDLSRSRWLKRPPSTVNCFTAAADGTERRDWVSKPITLGAIEKHLQGGSFDHRTFDLFNPDCSWLDTQIAASPSFHVVGSDGNALTFQLTMPLGSKFPLVPTIDREGTAYTSFQRVLIDRVHDLRAALVARSDRFAEIGWFQDLRSLFCECVSLIDTTLHQLYFKALYDPLPGWSFDEVRMGQRHGRRLEDKLSWVFAVTGRHMSAHQEIPGFREIKALRNHLQHFDPPCFAFSVEDVARWLNLVHDVARLAWRIRTAIGSPLSEPLIRLLLTPDVVFVPRDPNRPRRPQTHAGYASTRWRSP